MPADTMGWIILNVIMLVISDSLAGMNILSTVSNFKRPLEKFASDNKDFMQIVAESGYKAEKHEVITTDGYILTIFRIPPGRECAKKTPILLMHGLLLSSECFVASGPDAPAFVLAQDCHDLWFGNVRGNLHSRRHLTLNPDKNLEFWKFSTDEIGLYDVPATIDYVLDATDTKKLIYVGYSQGGGTFFIMNSEKPEYNDKISLFIGLAPGIRQYYTRSVSYRTATIAVNTLEAPLEAAGVWEILSTGFPVQGALSSLCQVKLLAAVVCGLGVAVLDSPHPNSVTPEIESRIFKSAPAGTSVQNLARYGQAMNEKKFVKFDYGSERNMEVYGRAEPPEYDLGASKMPIVILYGKGDHLVDTRDVEWAVGDMSNVLEATLVDDPLWNHVDMVYSRYWRDAVFVKIKKYLDKYSDINDPQ